ncbi:MAG: hypothetical protein K6T65_11680 [Peptococcaceae bacterium]|nr:hypothetical protein [Peptococcaceae bacterium]
MRDFHNKYGFGPMGSMMGGGNFNNMTGPGGMMGNSNIDHAAHHGGTAQNTGGN